MILRLMLSRLLLIALLFAALLAATASAAERSPNFVIIYIDDMGYGDIGPFGAQGYADAESWTEWPTRVE